MNTANNPKTIFEIPGPYCDMKVPATPIAPGSKFHAELLSAKTKGAVIEILCQRGSMMGWFSDMPDGLYDKLHGMRTSTTPAQK